MGHYPLGNIGARIGGGGGGGGGGWDLGPLPNTFGLVSTADKAAAALIRTTYENQDANWLLGYNENKSFFTQLVWAGGGTGLAASEASVIQRRNVGGTAWEDATGIIRGAPGATGGRGRKGDAAVIDYPALDARIAPFARAPGHASGQIGEARIPSAITRDTELAAAISSAKIQGLLGLTNVEVAGLFVGVSIAGRTLTFIRNDGSTVTIDVPATVTVNPPPPATHADQYLAGKATKPFTAGDFTGAQGVKFADNVHTAIMPTVTGNVFGAVARLASDPAPVHADLNNSGLNSLSDFAKQTATLEIEGATYDIYASTYAVFATGDAVEFR